MAGIGFFSPLPIALMIPFMAAQSLAMGEAFGSGFQYGKRRVSALTNDEFNKLSPKDLMLETTAGIESMIPAMKDSMANFATLQTDVIKELIKYVQLLGPALSQTAAEGGLDFSELLKGVTQAGGAALTQTAATLAQQLSGSFLPEAEARRGSQQTPGGGVSVAPPVAVTTSQMAAIVKIGLAANQGAGPNITPAQQAKNTQIASQPNNTLVIDADGNIINKDVRTAPTKLRAPKSIVILLRKYIEEDKAYAIILGKLGINNSQQSTKYRLLRSQLGTKIRQLKEKYIL